jgi:hypothetical protein
MRLTSPASNAACTAAALISIWRSTGSLARGPGRTSRGDGGFPKLADPWACWPCCSATCSHLTQALRMSADAAPGGVLRRVLLDEQDCDHASCATARSLAGSDTTNTVFGGVLFDRWNGATSLAASSGRRDPASGAALQPRSPARSARPAATITAAAKTHPRRGHALEDVRPQRPALTSAARSRCDDRRDANPRQDDGQRHWHSTQQDLGIPSPRRSRSSGRPPGPACWSRWRNQADERRQEADPPRWKARC